MSDNETREQRAARGQEALRAARARQKQSRPVGEVPVDAASLFKGRSQKQLAEEAAARKQEDRDESAT